MNRKQMMKELEGSETWTDAFSERFEERVCVLIQADGLVHEGEKFMPTVKEMKQVWDDYMENEGITQEIREMVN